MKIFFASIAILALAAGACLDQNQGALVNQETEVTYDKANYLTYELAGGKIGPRDESGQLMMYATSDSFIRLHIHRDKRRYDIDLITQLHDGKTTMPLISSRIDAAQYADRDHVWFVSSGHAGQHCVLYNIVDKKVVREYRGLRIQISPDGSKAAVVAKDLRNDEKRGRGNLVFVNGTMVYPVVEPGFTKWDVFSSDVEHEIQKPDGTSAADILKKRPEIQPHLVQDIAWRNDNILAFDVTDHEADTTATHYLMTGLADIGTSRPLKINIRKGSINDLRPKY